MYLEINYKWDILPNYRNKWERACIFHAYHCAYINITQIRKFSDTCCNCLDTKTMQWTAILGNIVECNIKTEYNSIRYSNIQQHDLYWMLIFIVVCSTNEMLRWAIEIRLTFTVLKSIAFKPSVTNASISAWLIMTRSISSAIFEKTFVNICNTNEVY